MDTAAALTDRRQPNASTPVNRSQNQTAGWDPEGQIPQEIFRQFQNHVRALTSNFDERRR